MDPRDLHITLDLLLKVEAGELSPRLLAERVAAHLPAVCGECAEQWEEYQAAKRGVRANEERSYRGVIQAAERRTRALAERLAADREAAAGEFEELLALSPDERLRRLVRTTGQRFSGPGLTERLLAEARTWLRHDPRKAEQLLAFAERQAWRLSPEQWGESLPAELTARVIAQRANAQRVAGELPAAEATFERLDRQLTAHPVLAPDTQAELKSLEASLRQDQRRFAEANQLLGEAERLYRKAGETNGVAKVLLKRAIVCRLCDDPATALGLVDRAAGLLTPHSDPMLRTSVVSEKAVCLCDAGKYSTARVLIAENRELYARLTDPSSKLRLQWLRGRIAAGLGDDDAALRLLHQVRHGYAELRLSYDEAMVSLDLAALHLKRGRTREVRRLAEAMHSVFVERQVHAESRRAVELFREAAAAEQVTLELIAALHRYFATARRDPRQRFQPVH